MSLVSKKEAGSRVRICNAVGLFGVISILFSSRYFVSSGCEVEEEELERRGLFDVGLMPEAQGPQIAFTSIGDMEGIFTNSHTS